MIKCPCGSTQENQAGLQWVACDVCDYWMHAYCVGIRTPTAFRALKGRKFVCGACQAEREAGADGETMRILESECVRLKKYLRTSIRKE
ncbi:PHD super family protein [Perkinsela sp. CCAP 1560/4]|nr:PHD super family protein [Perkinsela sp. CCAP 1560/4]|eukprot:KNH06796.1 PHD super family protein [Perkinsela sp. CCAP 1560/4]